MRTIHRIILVTIVFLLWNAPPAEAILYLATDPNFGPNSVTVDTSTGLGWLNLTETVGLSYNQVLAETQPGGTFSGYSFATVPEVMTLYASAGIPGPGYYPLSSPSIQSLFSLVGSTWSVDGLPATQGFSATPNGTLQDCPQIYASGVNSGLNYLVSGPGFYLLAVNPTLSATGLGSWLVKEVPEPSDLGICVLAAFSLIGFELVQRQHAAL